jgi:hypothetical protein
MHHHITFYKFKEEGENFSGILALLLWSSMEEDTKNGFEEMNKAIKSISEATN